MRPVGDDGGDAYRPLALDLSKGAVATPLLDPSPRQSYRIGLPSSARLAAPEPPYAWSHGVRVPPCVRAHVVRWLRVVHVHVDRDPTRASPGQWPKVLSTDWFDLASWAPLLTFLSRRFSLRLLAAGFLAALPPLFLVPILASRPAAKNGRQASLSHMTGQAWPTFWLGCGIVSREALRTRIQPVDARTAFRRAEGPRERIGQSTPRRAQLSSRTPIPSSSVKMDDQRGRATS